ncbi:respiratory nitrate reductase subunit gamma, partial [Candidatus Desantisbacteria bacterium]|nr:respiratory nitrate reductase subunit gamma [Candidatus Desantisbacteria bacterium]
MLLSCYTFFAYFAIVIFTFGILCKVWKYAIIPNPLKIPLTPAPTNAACVIFRMFLDIAFFKSLFHSNKFTWLGGCALHLALLVVLASHIRFFVSPVPELIMLLQTFLQSISMFIGLLFIAPIGYLFIRRVWVDRTRFISIFADYFVLILLFFIGLSGITMKYFIRPDLVAVKSFIIGLISFAPEPMPTNPIFITHFTLILILLVYFPFSKLMHGFGIFFSPTRNQIDNPRE